MEKLDKSAKNLIRIQLVIIFCLFSFFVIIKLEPLAGLSPLSFLGGLGLYILPILGFRGIILYKKLKKIGTVNNFLLLLSGISLIGSSIWIISSIAGVV